MLKNTIILKNKLNIYEEYVAAAAIIPGELIELTSAGLVQPHSTEGGNTLPMFAKEDELRGIGVDDSFAAGDRVQVWIPTRGDQVYAILEDNNHVQIGDFLESNGAGELQLYYADIGSGGEVEPGHSIVGVALETMDLTTSSGQASSGDLGLESSIDALGYNRRIVIRIL
ncbi:MAG TPA: hypothetical protein VMW53_02495 [archaeon]|nr:hypothetical protein [Bacteroidales bacterium]HUV81934.1 hypothetical protein [archaeon]